MTDKEAELVFRIVPVAIQYLSAILNCLPESDIRVLSTLLLKLCDNAGALDDLARLNSPST
ncbi:hypothetical protein [Caballeronia udeis]|uniref:hypothetical protein n=1 Tax=Caballeronia udeis TaxID=1232866 RepID=UPI0012E969BA|nr:hypothetical protein [Caballeronia udeis]